MRKVLSFFLVISVLVMLCAGASAETRKVGILSKLNMSQEDFSELIANARKAGTWSFFSSKPADDQIEFKFYDSLQALQLALNAKEIQEAALPEVVAEYVINVTGQYKISSIAKTKPAYFSFGFRAGDDPTLLNKFNNAILSMKEDGTLSALQAKYIYEPGIGDPEPVEFRKFDNVDDKIVVAVTGDIPPIDFVAPDGNAAGFNTAVIAAIAERLKINVELMYISSAARASALASKRADAVFWIIAYKNVKKQSDVPEGIVLSEPYYEWNEYLYISLAGNN